MRKGYLEVEFEVFGCGRGFGDESLLKISGIFQKISVMLMRMEAVLILALISEIRLAFLNIS